mmetsp:Transcript_2223/g.3382  ORF Transcript_2223/g.3382 Transcript_2223/m.3382 type:complete len:232 (-) Transcript_2223:426-1121(-)
MGMEIFEPLAPLMFDRIAIAGCFFDRLHRLTTRHLFVLPRRFHTRTPHCPSAPHSTTAATRLSKADFRFPQRQRNCLVQKVFVLAAAAGAVVPEVVGILGTFRLPESPWRSDGDIVGLRVVVVVVVAVAVVVVVVFRRTIRGESDSMTFQKLRPVGTRNTVSVTEMIVVVWEGTYEPEGKYEQDLLRMPMQVGVPASGGEWARLGGDDAGPCREGSCGVCDTCRRFVGWEV